MAAQGREQKQSFLQMSWVWGYSFLPQIAEIVISLRTQFLTFAQILAVSLANTRVPDSPTVKICTRKTYGTNDISPNLCHFLLHAWSWLATLAPHQSRPPALRLGLGRFRIRQTMFHKNIVACCIAIILAQDWVYSDSWVNSKFAGCSLECFDGGSLF